MKVETDKELFERLNAESVLPTAIDDGTEIIVSALSWVNEPILPPFGLKKSKFPGSIKVTITYPDKRVKTATYVFNRWDEDLIHNESEDKMKSMRQRPCPTRDSIDGQIVCSGFGMHPGKIACEYLDADTGICHSAHTNRIWSGDIPAQGAGRVYPTPPDSFDPFAAGCFPESHKDPLSEIIDPATVKRILDLTCQRAEIDLERSKRRRTRFSVIGDGDSELTKEKRAQQRERRKLWDEREHRESIAATYRRMAECHELTARLYKEQGLEEEAKEEMNNAIAASNDSTDVYFKVLEIEQALYSKNEEMFDDDVEVDD